MFNLKTRHHGREYEERNLLRSELSSFDIFPLDGGVFDIKVGDETVQGVQLHQCTELINEAITELKGDIFEEWKDLSDIATVIANNSAGNTGTLDNLYFLNSVKKSFHLSKRFTQLDQVTKNLYELFNIDIVDVSPDLISEFNRQYLKVHLLHRLIMTELYRLKIIEKYNQSLNKTAQVSGPWANLDLPMKERVWEWSEDDEEMDNREKAKQQQTRYNPEYNKEGFYFVWQDYNRDPYSFEDFQTDSPYKSQSRLAIP